MPNKKDDTSIYFKDWTTRKLKREAIAYHQSINDICCCGTRDVEAYEGIMGELDRRRVNYSIQLKF